MCVCVCVMCVCVCDVCVCVCVCAQQCVGGERVEVDAVMDFESRQSVELSNRWG